MKGGENNGEEEGRRQQAPTTEAVLKKLNVGCGGMKLPGYVNLDKYPHAHVDIQYDLESGRMMKWKEPRAGFPIGFPETVVPENYFDRMIMSHVFEHLRDPLAAMAELWRVAKPGCELVVITPYGSSDNAWEDPTHVRAVFMDTFMYFSQVWYEKNDYGYRADWHFDRRILQFRKEFKDLTEEGLGAVLQHHRNIVVEFTAVLKAVKPIRKHPFEFDTPKTAFKFAA